MFRRLIFLGCFLPSLCFAQTGLPKDFDQYVAHVLKTFEVPGVSIAVVQNGKVILSKGYGVKKMGSSEAIDEHSLFAIASNTKLFTATALCMLAEEGKLKLDDPVVDHLPYFRMSDPWITSEITIRDILVHNSGIPAYGGDVLIFPPSSYSRKELIEKVELLPIVRGFRSSYAYDNILYLVAGEIVKQVSGMEWEEYIRTRIFQPAGMNESVAQFSKLKSATNVSAAHTRVHGKVEPVELAFEQAIGDAGDPAGGIGSNAVDMAKWLLTQLDSGRTPDQHSRIFSPNTTNELWRMVVPMGYDKVPDWLKPSQTDFRGYALGIRSYNYGKYKILGHGGKLDGFVSQVAMVPQLGLGIAVLTNQESTGAYWSIIYRLMDHFMKNPNFDWVAGYRKQLDIALADQHLSYEKALVLPTPGTKPSLSKQQYLGTYRDKFYGDLKIEEEGDKWVLRFAHTPQLVADVVHHQYDSYVAHFRNSDLKADAYVNFALDESGKISQVTLKVIDPDCDLSFEGLVFTPTKK